MFDLEPIVISALPLNEVVLIVLAVVSVAAEVAVAELPVQEPDEPVVF